MAEPAANLPPPASPASPPNLQVVPPPPRQGWSLEAVAAIVGLLAVLVLLGFMLVPVARGMQPVLAEGAVPAGRVATNPGVITAAERFCQGIELRIRRVPGAERRPPRRCTHAREDATPWRA